MRPFKECVDVAEDRLMNQLREGNVRAYQILYNRYGLLIMRRLRALVLDPQAAEDLHQELFLQIWEHRGRLPLNVSFKAVLLHRAKLLTYKYYQRASKDHQVRNQLLVHATELYDQLNEQLSFKQTSEALEKAISKLPPQRQQIFRLVKMEGKTYEEVASICGISLSTVKDHMTRALKFVRIEMAHHNPSAFILFLLGEIFS